MPEVDEELLQLADALEALAERGMDKELNAPMDALSDACDQVGKSWSGSWWGYHANVYYAKLDPPPPGAHFSAEWGLMDNYGLGNLGSVGDWQEFNADYVKAVIQETAGSPDIAPAQDFIKEATEAFDSAKSTMLSVIETELAGRNDPFLEKLKEKVEDVSFVTDHDAIQILQPKGQFMTRDTIVLGQGQKVPPHLAIKIEVITIRHNMGSTRNLGKYARQAGSHLARQRRHRRRLETVGTNVFIGHGQSLIWRELKDFVEDRLKLPVDEFNRVPVAGVTNIARLSEMLDASVIAFLIFTGEDEQPDGKLHARMNVIHEAGLFQGRLGFTRAIVVLEDGCEEFTNIQGLGQVRFPKGNIKAAFEEIRQLLEREGLIDIDS